MAKIVTMGELMLRLSPPGAQRFGQATQFDIQFGGGEANVAASLAQWGHVVQYVSKLVDNPIGDAALANLRGRNIGCEHIVRGGKRLGIYYLENGVSLRPAQVIYDRADSAMSLAKAQEFDLDAIFKGADLFHVSGILPVLGDGAMELTRRACQKAKESGCLVSFDLNYRSRLWTGDVAERQRELADMMKSVDLCFGNARDAALMLGFEKEGIDLLNGPYEDCVNPQIMEEVSRTYGFRYLITSLRESISASVNGYSAACSDGSRYYTGARYQVDIVDRVGSGDAFAAGFLHGILMGWTMEKSLEYAIAAGAIKHTVSGDMNLASVEEIMGLIQTQGNGRVNR